MIKISHECPLDIIYDSRIFNDFDYCLVHLCEKYPEYYQYFESSISMGREVMLDNSIFELGTAFDSMKYAKVIEKLNPTYYIVPDALEDTNATIDNFIDFIEKYPDLPGVRVGVVQGKTYNSLVACYEFMKTHADYIAISFDYSYYQGTGIGNSVLERMSTGRVRLIENLISDRIWDETKPTHLLGCSLPSEFSKYKFFCPNIASIDTSNPIMAGIKNMRYASTFGLKNKPTGLLADHINIELNKEQKQLINYNISKFRLIVNG